MDRETRSQQEITDQIVTPVVSSLFDAHEVDQISLVTKQIAGRWVSEVEITVRGEMYSDTLEDEDWVFEGINYWEAVSARLRSHLQDWIAESKFGWGQLRPGGPA